MCPTFFHQFLHVSYSCPHLSTCFHMLGTTNQLTSCHWAAIMACLAARFKACQAQIMNCVCELCEYTYEVYNIYILYYCVWLTYVYNYICIQLIICIYVYYCIYIYMYMNICPSFLPAYYGCIVHAWIPTQDNNNTPAWRTPMLPHCGNDVLIVGWSNRD
jgi:hypothetical protein